MTGFRFAGDAKGFGYIIPLPGVPVKIEKGGDWTLERLSAIDAALLRVAAFELLYRDDIPARATLDEAIELSREYSTAESAGFVAVNPKRFTISSAPISYWYRRRRTRGDRPTCWTSSPVAERVKRSTPVVSRPSRTMNAPDSWAAEARARQRTRETANHGIFRFIGGSQSRDLSATRPTTMPAPS